MAVKENIVMFLPSEQSFIVSKFIGLEKKNIKQLIFFKCKTVINLVIKNGCLKKRLLILMLVWVFDYGTMGLTYLKQNEANMQKPLVLINEEWHRFFNKIGCFLFKLRIRATN